MKNRHVLALGFLSVFGKQKHFIAHSGQIGLQRQLSKAPDAAKHLVVYMAYQRSIFSWTCAYTANRLTPSTSKST